MTIHDILEKKNFYDTNNMEYKFEELYILFKHFL